MATACDSLEVDLSRTDLEVTWETQPCIDVEVEQVDITIEIPTVANQGPIGPVGPEGPKGDQGVSGPPGPQGLPGGAATIAVGSTVTGSPGTAASVTNSGSSSAAVFNFAIPRGDKGDVGAQGNTGAQGPAATIAVGTTTTSAAGSNAAVSNTGSSSAAVFNFTIPRGDVGAQGPQGPAGAGTGDMLRSVYDPNGNNIVEQAEAVPWTGVTGKPATFPPDATAELVARKGVANGYPSLDASTLVPIAQLPAPPTGDASTTQLVKGNDSRLTNARTPTAHGTTHLDNGTDVVPVVTTARTGLAPKLSGTATTYLDGTGAYSAPPGTAGNMLKSVYDTNADNIVDQAAAVPWTGVTGKPTTFPPDSTAELVARKGVASGYPSLDAVALVPIAQLPAPTSGDATSAQLVKGSDSRLTNARTPTAHAATHLDNGTDAIALATTTRTGLLTKTSGLTTDYLRGDHTFQNLATAIGAIGAVPSGSVVDYAGSSAPSGWLLCDGTAVSRSTYAALFTAISTTYGTGDGSTTFNLPDLRGRAAIGAGQGSGLTNRALAAKGGEESHPLTIAELAVHTHIQDAHNHTIPFGTSGLISVTGGGYSVATPVGTTDFQTATNQNTGSGTAHNTMQPFVALNKIIKT